MSIFWIVFFIIYGCGHFIFWFSVLADNADCVRRHYKIPDYLSLHPGKISKDEWITTCWLSLFWPIVYTYMFFRYWFIPFIKFIIYFIIYPFKKLYESVHKKDRNDKKDPIHYRIAKWIVKKYNL